MGPDFSRLVHAAIAAGGLGLIGCGQPAPCETTETPPPAPQSEGSGEGDPPVLLEVKLISATVLELSFSKPLAPVNDVEPLDFAISLATTSLSGAYYGCPVLTNYQDLGSGTPADVTGIWNLPDDPELMRLSISLPITPAHCDTIDNARANGNEGGIFVHYAAQDGASVQDEDGNRLSDVSAPWARFDPGSYYYYEAPDEFQFCSGSQCTAQGMFPNMEGYLPIPCPRG